MCFMLFAMKMSSVDKYKATTERQARPRHTMPSPPSLLLLLLLLPSLPSFFLHERKMNGMRLGKGSGQGMHKETLEMNR